MNQPDKDVEDLTEGIDRVEIIQNKKIEGDKLSGAQNLVEIPIFNDPVTLSEIRKLVTWKRARRTNSKSKLPMDTMCR